MFSIVGYEWLMVSLTKIKVTVAGYDGNTIKQEIPIGMGLTAIDLPDDTKIIIWSNEAKIQGKGANTLFSETHTDHNGDNTKSTDNGLGCIEVDVHIITVTVQNTMLYIKIRKPIENKLCICTKLTSPVISFEILNICNKHI